VQRIHAGEPRRLEVVRSQSVGCSAIRDERALATGADEHADPAGPDPGDPCRPNKILSNGK
jgi:hypothetical protein